ncbi:uncharacterized protein LOC144106629 [Amblyomma americanum]
MASRSINAATVILFTTVPLLVLLQVAAASEVPHGCSWKETVYCYFKLTAHAFINYQLDDTGNINAEEHAKDCLRMTMPSVCHDQLSVCPAHVKANLSSFEEGYRQLRDFICDIDAVKGFLKVAASVPHTHLQRCLQKYQVQTSQSVDQCRETRASATCVAKLLQQTSPADYETLNAFNKRLHTALLMMHGCELPSEFTPDLDSSQTTIVPHSYILALVVAIFLLRLKSV